MTVTRPGFEPVCKNEMFLCAFITASEQYAPGKVASMKRHNGSDEVFVLLKGKATLLTGDPLQKQYTRTVLQTGVSYCVEAGTWHYLAVSEDAMIFVAENSQVSKLNTDEIRMEDQQITVEL